MSEKTPNQLGSMRLGRASTVVLACVIVLFSGIAIVEAVVERPIAESDIEELTERALNGNGKAAAMLAGHYSILGNRREDEYWSRIAFENGDPGSLQFYAAKLWSSGGERNCKRALYLYDRVLKSGPTDLGEEVRSEIQGQRDSMLKDLARCASSACVASVDGAWCD